MQFSAGSTLERKPPDAAFGAFLFALGIMPLVLFPWVSAVGFFVTMLLRFTAGLLIGGLCLIIKDATRRF